MTVAVKYVTVRTEASTVPRNSAIQLLIGYTTTNSPTTIRMIEKAFELPRLVINEFTPGRSA